MLRIIVVDPGQEPEVREVEDLCLECMQDIVGGLIEYIRISPDIDLWFNQEGRVRRLQFNRWVTDSLGQEWDIFGPMFLAGVATGAGLDEEDGETTEGLSDLQILAWSQRLTLPEVKIPEVAEGFVSVWHAQHPNFFPVEMTETMAGVSQPHWPADFIQVALVETDELETAYRQTNHIQRAWTENEDVQPLTSRPRSSSVGDVFVLPGGKAMRVAGCGFVEVTDGS